MTPQGHARPSRICQEKFSDLSIPKVVKDPLNSRDGGHWNFTLANVVGSRERVHMSSEWQLHTMSLIQGFGPLAYHSVMAGVKVKDSMNDIILILALDSHSS